MKRPHRHPEITAHMGAFIKQRRKLLGLTLEGLAEKIDSSKSYVWELENGRRPEPSLWSVLGLCNGLQCSMNDLLGRDVSQPEYTASEMALIDAHRRIYADQQ